MKIIISALRDKSIFLVCISMLVVLCSAKLVQATPFTYEDYTWVNYVGDLWLGDHTEVLTRTDPDPMPALVPGSSFNAIYTVNYIIENYQIMNSMDITYDPDKGERIGIMKVRHQGPYTYMPKYRVMSYEYSFTYDPWTSTGEAFWNLTADDYLNPMLLNTWLDTYMPFIIEKDGTSRPVITPEPSTMLLLAGGLAGLAFWRRKSS